MKPIEELQEENETLKLKISKLESEIYDMEWESMSDSSVSDLENEVSELEDALEKVSPVPSANFDKRFKGIQMTIVDLSKIELLRDNWNKFTLEQLERFIEKLN